VGLSARVEAQTPRVDRYGNPLPAGALARLGKQRPGHDNSASYGIAFLPDGKRVISGGYDGIYIWDLTSRQELRRITLTGGACGLVLSPDGKTVATANRHVCLFDLATSKRLRELGTEPVDAPGGTARAAFAPDGKTVASITQSNILRLWNAATGEQLWET